MSSRLVILPKKKWNVWNRENIAKVRNDEKQHEEELAAAALREKNLSSEARLDILRVRANDAISAVTAAVCSDSNISITQSLELPVSSSSTSIPGDVALVGAPEIPLWGTGHVNLFADLEYAMGVNEEHERERREKEMREVPKNCERAREQMGV